MTERGRRDLARDADSFRVGPSGLYWDGHTLTIEFDERGDFIPRRAKGVVRVTPELIADTSFALDPAGKHRWHPVAPRARVEIELAAPALRWAGHGYLDSNFGDEPLEAGFRDWQWSRAHLSSEVAVLYEGVRRGGERFALSLRCDGQGRWREVEAPAPARLTPSLWLLGRKTRSEGRARIMSTWEDGPFYARSKIRTTLDGETVDAVHESLSLDRLKLPIVRAMLPYRMPRVAG